MKIHAERVSLKLDAKTLCHPTDGYNNDFIEVDLRDYDQIAPVSPPLQANDAVWPKGAPLADIIRYKDMILKRKQSQS